MGSIAQDNAGNLGLGYSVSGSAAYPDPGIAVTGALAGTGATPGPMQAERLVFAGPNFQDTYNRWGDYSSMSLAPDDCTFWYTTEYSTTTNLLGIDNFFWGTIIASFQLTGCTPH
jgi:hypothetical protein